jgi:hypothetical protein
MHVSAISRSDLGFMIASALARMGLIKRRLTEFLRHGSDWRILAPADLAGVRLMRSL